MTTHFRKRFAVLAAALAMTFTLGMVNRADAVIITLSDVNSTATFDIRGGQAPGANTIPLGHTDWVVDGVDQMFQQWFWFRIGSTGPEQSIDTLNLVGTIASNTDFDPGDDTLVVRYQDMAATFEVEIKYTLQGGSLGSNGSDIGEQIMVRSINGNAISGFHFFQYSDFDLGATPGGDTVLINGFDEAQVSGDSVIMSETVVTPDANHREAAFFDSTRAKLNDADADDLDDVGGPLGPGDVTWAFQWDFNLGVNDSFQISKDKRLSPVPEPGSLLLVGMASACLAGGYGIRRWRRVV